ncbi:Proline racemase [Pseudovibrio axinellae]|uniref:4-hydroxyproline epimerase n=1 Tax=Pseudovibrio axinellae TaxID=989403 RepID=A0A165YW40_9HYPH|nr:proline racemase family protein [Pseudovibrio axinellae]KZL19288.1 Proline racemase [Pseudovibrio axinellae]SEQ42761.1 proline racemase [Pseudovibrio axinellae]
MLKQQKIDVVDMHTAGEPLRIVTRGYPEVLGETILAKRRYARDTLDHLRQFLMFEPRGHFDMYGAVLVEPSHPEAHFGVLFIHNEGYSTMCGHAVIALGRYAVDHGLVAATSPVTQVRIECPCGLVVACVDVKDGIAGAVSFRSVPAFLHSKDVVVDVKGLGELAVDVAYGGAFYGLAPASAFGLDVQKSSSRDLVDAANAVSDAVRAAVRLHHPDDADLAFLYGTLLTDGNDAYSPDATANICVFADSQVDRSPTGSGVTARLAAQAARGLIAKGQTRRFESLISTCFEGTYFEDARCGQHDAIIAQVAGKAHYSGTATFWREQDDPVGNGFLLR